MKKSSSLLEKFINLVKIYGTKNELFTFNYCTDYGCSLNNSTIDMIVFDGETIKFYYNINTGDFDYFDDVKQNNEDITKFYEDIEKYASITNEWCPYCETEVEIPSLLGIHICPSCGYQIINCSVCEDLKNNVKDCCTNCVLQHNVCRNK